MVTKSLGILRQIKVRLKVCSLGRRRASWLDKLVQVDSISNTSGSVDEGLHEGLEVISLGVGNLEGHELSFMDFLAMDADQSQSHIGTTPSR